MAESVTPNGPVIPSQVPVSEETFEIDHDFHSPNEPMDVDTSATAPHPTPGDMVLN